MKLFFYCQVLFSSLIFSQSYLNIHFADGTTQNSSLSSLTRITFNQSSGLAYFYCTDVGTQSRSLNTIQGITFDNNGSGSELPIELSSFTCNLNGSNINLAWETKTEKNSNKFEILKKPINAGTSSEWETINYVKAAVLSNSPKYYSYVDKQLQPGKYNYRLKMIDNDGTFEYSKVIEADISVPKDFNLSQNFPNPFNPVTKIAYNVPTDGVVSLIVYDIMGKEVVSLKNGNVKAGRYESSFDGSRLASGIYLCEMRSGRFTGVIKMLIIK